MVSVQADHEARGRPQEDANESIGRCRLDVHVSACSRQLCVGRRVQALDGRGCYRLKALRFNRSLAHAASGPWLGASSRTMARDSVTMPFAVHAIELA